MLEERTSEGAGYSAESAGGLLLEERLLRVGKALGFEGSRLAQYVERKVTEVNARREQVIQWEEARAQRGHAFRVAEAELRGERSAAEAASTCGLVDSSAVGVMTVPSTSTRITFPMYKETTVVFDQEARGRRASVENRSVAPTTQHSGQCVGVSAMDTAEVETEIKVVNGNSALGTEAGCTVSVACIEAKMERQWQMEEPPRVANNTRENPAKRFETQCLVVSRRKANQRPPESDVPEAIKLMKRWNVSRRMQCLGNVLREEYSDDDQRCLARSRIDRGVRNTRVDCGVRAFVCLGL